MGFDKLIFPSNWFIVWGPKVENSINLLQNLFFKFEKWRLEFLLRFPEALKS
jgi:hypothetical protein